jgi:hypothetical protein
MTDDGALRPVAVLHRCSVAMDRDDTGWHRVTRCLGVEATSGRVSADGVKLSAGCTGCEGLVRFDRRNLTV